MATMQLLEALSSRSGIAGIPCQFSRRRSSRQQLQKAAKASGRRNVASVGRAPRMRVQAAAEEGEGAGAGGDGGGDGDDDDDDDDFEARLAKLQRKVTSGGAGKKAQLRKSRKESGADAYAAAPSSSAKPKKESLFIPPVQLKEPVSDGLAVEFGFTPYTERLHGRLAALGLAAVLLVELATGDSLVRFHDSGTLGLQVYAVVGVAVLFVKYEKERISIWPKS